MATPTEIVTRNAQIHLGSQYDVVMAVRVEWGVAAARVAKNQGAALFAHVWTPFVMPVLSVVRARSIRRRMREDSTAGVGILALTADDQRILMSAMPLRRKTPTGIVEKLPDGAALVPDVDLMETDVVPMISVGEYDLVVDRVDFKALLKAVEALELRAPELKAQLERLGAVGEARYG